MYIDMLAVQQVSKKENSYNGAKNISPFFRAHSVQAKLQVNEPADGYEREADSIADRVMSMRDTSNGNMPFFKPAATIQRKCQHCEEEEKIKVQRKESLGMDITGSNNLDRYVSGLASSGQSLPDTSKRFFESRFGNDFSNVKVHTDSVAAKSAQSINALAYTSGNHIVFNEGQYSPDTDSGKKLMAHELTHVIQQTGTSKQAIQRQPAAEPSPTEMSACTMHFVKASTEFTNAKEFDGCMHKIKDYLKANSNGHVTLHGFASDEGTPDFNMDLSKRRAETVLRLLKAGNTDTSRITIEPHGADSTFTPTSEAERAKNRRVEVVNMEKMDFPPENIEVTPPKCPTTAINGCLPITLYSDTKHCGADDDFMNEDHPGGPVGADHKDDVDDYKSLTDIELLAKLLYGYDGIANLGSGPGKDAALHFYLGSAKPVDHDASSVIGKAADGSDPFNAAAAKVESTFHGFMVRMANNPSANNCSTLNNATPMPHVNFPASKWQLIKGEFSDSDTVMLKAVIGGTHGIEIILTSFKSDCDAKTYEATIHYRLCDNFGVDETDMYSGSLVAFWMLQHMRTGHKAFVNNILLDRTIKGTF
jgi:outer membrane protein OmpA-like peptidoglycan-associated protein